IDASAGRHPLQFSYFFQNENRGSVLLQYHILDLDILKVIKSCFSIGPVKIIQQIIVKDKGEKFEIIRILRILFYLKYHICTIKIFLTSQTTNDQLVIPVIIKKFRIVCQQCFHRQDRLFHHIGITYLVQEKSMFFLFIYSIVLLKNQIQDPGIGQNRLSIILIKSKRSKIQRRFMHYFFVCNVIHQVVN